MTWLIGLSKWRALAQYASSLPTSSLSLSSLLPTPKSVHLILSFQGEHGIGLGKKDSLKKELGPGTIDIMRSVKRALDPHWLLNPGKIFDAEKKDP